MAADSEFAWIRRIRQRTPVDPARVPIGPGDDMGAVAGAVDRHGRPEPVLVTTDLIAEGTDFLIARHSPERIGWKALAVSLSDVAAMAARPTGAVVAVLLPEGADRIFQEGLRRGVAAASAEFDCPVIGGDVNAWPGGLVLTTTVFGRPDGIKPVLRSGARPGDTLAVTGRLGGSILGRHLDFRPRVAEARALARATWLNAMIDLSDGLSSDLGHLCRESGVGADVVRSLLPVSADAVRRSRQTGRPAWRHALDDGEDFELLFAVSPSVWQRLASDPPFSHIPIRGIGTFTDLAGRGDAPVRLVEDDGMWQPLRPGGWEHLAPRGAGSGERVN